VLRGSYEKSVVCSANNAFDIFDCMDRIFSAYFIQIPMDSLFTLNKECHHQFCVENLVISTVLWMQMYAFFSQCNFFLIFFQREISDKIKTDRILSGLSIL
jgi:hypothetical protein